MKFLSFGYPQRLFKTCKILSYSGFLWNCKYDIIKLNTKSIRFSNRKYKGREESSNETKNERKKYRTRKYKLS